MNADFLLDAVGLIDDDLILDAEAAPAARKAPPALRRWAPLAACLALVIALGWSLPQMFRMGSAGSPSNSSGAGAPEASADGTTGEAAPPADQSPSGGSSDAAGDRPACIFVDGTLYFSTDKEIAGKVDESAIRGTTTYTDGIPDQEGETNFSREGTLYAVTADGVVVLIEEEWVLFIPA